MKKFKFRLQKLLDARIAKEKEIQHELAKVIARQNVFRERQQELRSTLVEQQANFSKDMRVGNLQVQNFVNFQRYWDFAGKAIEDAQKEIDRIEPEVAAVRERLSVAVQERKTIEKFREKKQTEWQKQVQRAADRELDDINQKVYMRHRMQSGGEPQTWEVTL